MNQKQEIIKILKDINKLIYETIKKKYYNEEDKVDLSIPISSGALPSFVPRGYYLVGKVNKEDNSTDYRCVCGEKININRQENEVDIECDCKRVFNLRTIGMYDGTVLFFMREINKGEYEDDIFGSIR